MFKQRSKFKEISLSLVLIFSLLLSPVHNVYAATDVNQGIRNVWDKVEKYVTTALKTSVLSALMNVATMTTQKLAYDAAMYLTAGGSGQQSLFEPRGWKEYGKMLGEQAMGEFVGSLAGPWQSLGLNICEPSPLQKLEFQKAFTQDINVSVPKLQMANMQPAAPKCDWSTIKSSYKKLAQSVEDFEVDMSFDLNLNMNLTQGETMSPGDALGSLGSMASGAQQSLNTLSAQLTSLTEKLYGQGIDLSKLWLNSIYIKRLLNESLDSASLTDEKQITALKEMIFSLRKAVYSELDKKVKNLEKSLNGERKDDLTLKKTLTESTGDLYFWKNFRKEYEAAGSNEDNAQAILRKYLLDDSNVNKLLRQQLWDRLLVMQLISDKKINNDLIKYVYYADIDKYVKSSGDGLSSFVSYIQPGANPSSVGMTLSDRLSSTTAQYAQKAQELADNKGFKAVTDVVSGRVKTPADLVQEQYKQTTIKDPAATKQTTLMGAYTNAGVGMALLNTAVNTFTSTVFNNLMNKVYSGLFKPDQMIANDGVSAGLTQSQLAKKLSANINIQMVSVKTEMTDFNILNEYAICPSEYATSNNCVIHSGFVQALQGSKPMSIQEAITAGLLDANWQILPKGHSMNADKDCFEKAFCYSNLQKLRHSRIISTAWELVGDLCENQANIEYCSVSQPFTLGEAVSNFYNCGQDEDHPYHILCNLIDPNWILKLPAQKCQTWAYGNSVIDPNMAERQQYCADDVSCVQEDANGACLAWGYCTREKNVWRFDTAQTCLPEQDSCRSFADSQGQSFSFLKNTLLLDNFNTCNSENIGCAWYSKNKAYDNLTGMWQWQDNFNANNEATDRIYLTAQAPTCSATDEGCSKLVRALPRLGTNLLPNSDFSNFVKKDGNAYFESWKVNSGATVEQHKFGSLLTAYSSDQGLSLFQPINILAKNTPRYFIYSAQLLVPQSLLTASESYNWDSNWRLQVDAYKPGNTVPRDDYVYDGLGNSMTDSNIYYQSESYINEENILAEVELSWRFAVVPDVDRLSVGVSLMNFSSNVDGNQVIIKRVQLEEVGVNNFSASPYQSYATENLVYLKKAPDYYQCYQNWHNYSESECSDKNGYWNFNTSLCEAPDVCSRFTPYCSIDEVGCARFVNVKTEDVYNMVVSADDYCPAVCVGYEKLYEVSGQFTEGRFVNLIAGTASTCPYNSIGCEEFTGVSDDGSLENKYYFTYNRTCQVAGASDCQTFYTWDNPDGFDKSIKSYTLKSFNNEPIVTEDDSTFCNESIYNEGINPYCYKFYAVRGGENIDLDTVEASAYVSYHLIDKTITCSNNCKPYRLARQVTESQCLSKGAGLNRFVPGTGDLGTCTVYAILSENPNCSSLNVGCREYRGSRNHSYFSLLFETFEQSVFADLWQGGARVKEAVQRDGYSWQNLGSSTVIANLDNPVMEGNLYLLTFWARRASAGNDRLTINLSGAVGNFTESDGINLDTRWQQYVLGPVHAAEDIENPILRFSGMNVGNLFIDNVELREVEDSYAFVADSWEISSVCDQIPDTNITVPGYMLGCDAYLDNYGYTHYLKSFTQNCREEAVGCELVLDTKNNLEGNQVTYNAKTRKEIGDLVLPVVESEIACLSGNNIWERGNCHHSFIDSPINQKQCELWGYYWLGEESTGKCVNDTVADDIVVSSDQLISLVLDQSYLCSASSAGCTAYGKPVSNADDRAITCNLGSVCLNSQGCLCRQAETNDYICTVPIGQLSCQMDTVYVINNPSQYEATLCTANSKGCDKFTDSQNSIWYFRNPGNRLCEYKELRIEGQLKTGWFKRGSSEPCYSDYQPKFGLWGSDQSLDYYLAGIDDLKNYDFYVGACSPLANMCTKFVDPTADGSSQRDYYLLDNGSVDNNSCNGQVNLAEGCILLNNTNRNNLTYSAEKTYYENFQADYQPVAPQIGTVDISINPLTGYKNPYYNVTTNVATAAGFVRVDLGDGVIQNYPYIFPVSTGESSSGSGLLQTLDDLGGSNTGILLPGSNLFGNTVLQGVSIQSLDTNTVQVPENWAANYENVYRDVVAVMAQQGDEDSFVNNSNTVVKVQRDRACAEWLAPADQEVVAESSGSITNTTFNLLSCQKSAGGECVQLAPSLPPQYLDYRLYSLRGFGWNALDYSGYSLPNRYSLDAYKQIYLENEQRLSLALDWKESCVRDSDCDVSGARCLDGRCYDVRAGQTKYDLVSCRAYPEASSPFVYSLGNPLLQSEQVNRCYPMTGYCADQFSGTVKDYSKSCYSDLECDPLQRCVFDNKATVDNCDCNYTKLTYSDLGNVNVYTDLNDDKLSDMGLCSGGVNDGLPCFGDNECLGTQNRTMFRSQSTLKIFQNEMPNGRCIFPSNAQKQQGWKGFCLEKDAAGQCITWWPVNRLLGDHDLYYKDKTVGLPYLNRYYCLHEDTLYKRLLVGGYSATKDTVGVYATKTILGGGLDGDDDVTDWGLFFRTILRASQSYNTDIFYLSDDDRFQVGPLLSVTEFVQTVPFYPGAIVKVEGKNNFTERKWFGEDDFDIGYGSVNPRSILEYIKERWEGQSCFYMMLDVVDKYTNMFCEIKDNNSIECPSFANDVVVGSGESPIIVSCALGDNISNAEIINYPVSMSLNLADKLSFIRGLYEQHQNRCVTGIFTGATTHKVFDLFQRVCEYNNIRQIDYPLLFAGLGDKNVWRNANGIIDDFKLNFSSKRFTSANIGGTEKICDLMAELRDEKGNHLAYTDNFSKNKALSLWLLQGKDYAFDAQDKTVFATDSTNLRTLYPSLYTSTNYQIPSVGSGLDSASEADRIKYYLAASFGSYKILPIIVPRALVKNKLDLYTSPQPFGAIIGNNLYQPYILPNEGSNLFSRTLIVDNDDNNFNDSLKSSVKCSSPSNCDVSNVQNRGTAQLPSDSGDEYTEYIHNLLFSLFNGIYNLKEYHIDLKSAPGETAKLFANKIMGTYQNSDRVVKAQKLTTAATIASVFYRGDNNPLCMQYDFNSRTFKDLNSNGNNSLVSLGSTNSSGNDLLTKTHEIICKNNYRLMESGCSWTTFEGVTSYTCNDLSGEEVIVNEDKKELRILWIKKPSIQLINQDPPPFVPNYIVYNNKQLSLDFYASADKNALPIRKLSVLWGDNQNSSYKGFIQNHQAVCDEDDFYDNQSANLLFDLSNLDNFKETNSQWLDVDSYGTCGPVCINWPVGQSGTEVQGQICYGISREKLGQILGVSGTTISPELEGEVYGHLYKQSLRCAIKDWDRFDSDLCIPVFGVFDGTFVGSICESDENNKIVPNAIELFQLSGNVAVIKSEYIGFRNGFVRPFQLTGLGFAVINPVKDTNAQNFLSAFRTHFDAEKRIYDLYTQGAAGETRNCVDKPFSFKHWYRDIFITDEDGNYVCKFGQAVDEEGDAVANGSADVVYCKLAGKIEVEDNMGKSSSQDFTVMVPVRFILGSFQMFLGTFGAYEGSTSSTTSTPLQLFGDLNLGGSFSTPIPPLGGTTIPRFTP